MSSHVLYNEMDDHEEKRRNECEEESVLASYKIETVSLNSLKYSLDKEILSSDYLRLGTLSR